MHPHFPLCPLPRLPPSHTRKPVLSFPEQEPENEPGPHSFSSFLPQWSSPSLPSLCQALLWAAICTMHSADCAHEPMGWGRGTDRNALCVRTGGQGPKELLRALDRELGPRGLGHSDRSLSSPQRRTFPGGLSLQALSLSTVSRSFLCLAQRRRMKILASASWPQSLP